MPLLSFIKKWFILPPQPTVEPVTYVPPQPHSYANRIRIIREIASQAGYIEIDLQEVNKMISFKRGDVRINVYYSTMTVGTCVNHPKQGKTQLFRRNVGQRLLAELFKNPRLHTGQGYKLKGNHAN